MHAEELMCCYGNIQHVLSDQEFFVVYFCEKYCRFQNCYNFNMENICQVVCVFLTTALPKLKKFLSIVEGCKEQLGSYFSPISLRDGME